MPKRYDLTGQRFGRLLILSRVVKSLETPTSAPTYWNYRCECGKEGTMRTHSLTVRGTQSCGCLQAEGVAARMLRHGHFRTDGRTPTYNAWAGMLQRVGNPCAERYEHYGARGITVCERWRDFKNFLADMGERPDGLTLERRDVDGNYEPENCYWASNEVQANNKQQQAKWLIDGKEMTAAQASRYWNLTPHFTRQRLESRPLHAGRIPAWHNDYRKDA